MGYKDTEGQIFRQDSFAFHPIVAGATVSIHAAGIPWHKRYSEYFKQGFTRVGLKPTITNSKVDTQSDIAVVLGPNSWHDVQDQRSITGMPYIMVNRCFWGNHNNTVAIGWNGLNNRGDYCTDRLDPAKYEDRYGRASGYYTPNETTPELDGALLLCGQHSAHTTQFGSVRQYYDYAVEQCEKYYPGVEVQFRPHPTEAVIPHKLVKWDGDAIFKAITLNSTVAVKLVMNGVPTVALDCGNPMYNVCAKAIHEDYIPTIEDVNRTLSRLSWSQWYYEEIQDGAFWQLLKHGPNNYPHKAFRW